MTRPATGNWTCRSAHKRERRREDERSQRTAVCGDGDSSLHEQRTSLVGGAGYPDACSCWGKFETLDEVRDIYAEWAEENFDRENGPSEGYETEEERDKAREAEVARARETLSLEWHDDLKWVKTRKMAERRDGEVEVVEVLGPPPPLAVSGSIWYTMWRQGENGSCRDTNRTNRRKQL